MKAKKTKTVTKTKLPVETLRQVTSGYDVFHELNPGCQISIYQGQMRDTYTLGHCGVVSVRISGKTVMITHSDRRVIQYQDMPYFTSNFNK